MCRLTLALCLACLTGACSDAPSPSSPSPSSPSTAAQAVAPEPTSTFDPPQARALTVEAMGQADAPEQALDTLNRALQHRPNYLDPLLLKAGALLALGNEQAALQTVATLSAFGHDLPLDQDPRLEKLWSHPDLLSAVTRQRQSAAQSVVRSTPAFRLQQRDLIPESVVFDPPGDFYISSVRQRKIVRYRGQGGTGGTGEVHELVGPDGDGHGPIFSVLGMAIDPVRRTLWAVSAALPQTQGFSEAWQGRSELLKIDLDSGTIAGRLTPPTETPSQLNDVTVAPDGTVYVTSSLPPGGVFRGSVGGSPDGLEPFGEPGLRSPQGLAVSEDGTRLFVADYSYGIAVFDTATGRRDWLAEPAGFFLSGIDGLTRIGDDLIAIQNGIRPHRVLRLRPDLQNQGFKLVEVLEQGHPDYSEPTLGVGIADGSGDRFVYVANSQWDKFDQDQNLPAVEQLSAPLFLSLPIPEQP